MLKIIPSSRFRKDYVLMKRQGKDIPENRSRLITGADKAGNPCRPSLEFFRGCLTKGVGMENEAKSTEMERKRWIESRYYIYNRIFPASIDDSGYQQVRQKFLFLFPEFPESIFEKYDSDPAKIRSQVRDQIRSFAHEERIWADEVTVMFWDLFYLAHEALNRNMKDFLGEDFPPPSSKADVLYQSYERLQKRLAELKDEAKLLPEHENCDRAQMEVKISWEIIRRVPLYCKQFSDNFKHQLWFGYLLGVAHGMARVHLMVFNKENVETMKDLYSFIKASEAGSSGWDADRELYKQAKIEADEYWKGGGKKFHHELAKDLAIKYFGRSDDRAPSMKKKLIPIAEKYSKVSGKKGVKKEN